MASVGLRGAKLSCVAIGTPRVSARRARCRFWDPTRLQTVLFEALSGGSLTTAETTAPQGLCRACAMQQCRKRQHLRSLRPTVSWHLATMRVHLGRPPHTGWHGRRKPGQQPCVCACQPASRSCDAGWQSVRGPWRAVRGDLRIRRIGC